MRERVVLVDPAERRTVGQSGQQPLDRRQVDRRLREVLVAGRHLAVLVPVPALPAPADRERHRRPEAPPGVEVGVLPSVLPASRHPGLGHQRPVVDDVTGELQIVRHVVDVEEPVPCRQRGRETVQYVGNIYKYYVAYRLAEEREAEVEKARQQPR
jgi:hypothetical protein